MDAAALGRRAPYRAERHPGAHRFARRRFPGGRRDREGGPMNWIGYTMAQFRLSQRVYWKRIGVALSGTLVPLGLGMFMPLAFARAGQIDGAPAGLYAFTGFLAFALFFTVYNLVNAVTARRDALIYKRLRTSPLLDTSIFVGEGAAAALP